MQRPSASFTLHVFFGIVVLLDITCRAQLVPHTPAVTPATVAYSGKFVAYAGEMTPSGSASASYSNNARTSDPSPNEPSYNDPGSLDAMSGNITAIPYVSGVECALRPILPPPPMHLFSHIAVGVYVSTLGPGVEVALPLSNHFNVRAGFNLFEYSTSITQSGITYGADITLRSAQASLDWFPRGKKFHISPGVLLYNGNRVNANLMIPVSTSFALDSVSYYSDPADPLTGSAKMSFPMAGPQLTFGFGNMLPRWKKQHFSIPFEFGAAYFGNGTALLQFTGSACTSLGGINCMPVNTFTRFQTDLAAEQTIIENDLHYARIFPILHLGISYKF